MYLIIWLSLIEEDGICPDIWAAAAHVFDAVVDMIEKVCKLQLMLKE